VVQVHLGPPSKHPGQPPDRSALPSSSRGAPAAPLARLPRRALPWEARPAQAGPHQRGRADQSDSHVTQRGVQRGPSTSLPDCPARARRLKAAFTGVAARWLASLDPAATPTDLGACEDGGERVGARDSNSDPKSPIPSARPARSSSGRRPVKPTASGCPAAPTGCSGLCGVVNLLLPGDDVPSWRAHTCPTGVGRAGQGVPCPLRVSSGGRTRRG
jgi:hypothetical protein